MNHVESAAMPRSNRTSIVALASIVLSLIGLGVSVAIYALHRQLAADPSFGSFCNVNEVVNCDVVLTSQYAKVLGVPVAAWAAGYYLTLALLAAVAGYGAWPGAAAASVRNARQAAAAVFVLAGFGLVFSGYMAVVALAVIRAVCLMCGALYLVALGLFATGWRLRRAFAVESRALAAARARQDRWVMAGAAAATAAVIAVGVWEAMAPALASLPASEIAKRSPEFYRWYVAQPVLQVPADGGKELGPADAPITIVEYSDFECGHCAALAKSLHQALPRYRGQVRVVFHHFPLDRACNPAVPNDFHRSACRAAVAAECAAEQERFWPFHDLMFANQQRLDAASLLKYAERVGCDRSRFEACIETAAARARVERDVRAGVALGVESTPTFFVNGRIIKGALTPELMSYAIALARAALPSLQSPAPKLAGSTP